MSLPISSRTSNNWLYFERLEAELELLAGEEGCIIVAGISLCWICFWLLFDESGLEICVKLTELFASNIACSARKEFMSRFILEFFFLNCYLKNYISSNSASFIRFSHHLRKIQKRWISETHLEAWHFFLQLFEVYLLYFKINQWLSSKIKIFNWSRNLEKYLSVKTILSELLKSLTNLSWKMRILFQNFGSSFQNTQRLIYNRCVLMSMTTQSSQTKLWVHITKIGTRKSFVDASRIKLST